MLKINHKNVNYSKIHRDTILYDHQGKPTALDQKAKSHVPAHIIREPSLLNHIKRVPSPGFLKCGEAGTFVTP